VKLIVSANNDHNASNNCSIQQPYSLPVLPGVGSCSKDLTGYFVAPVRSNYLSVIWLHLHYLRSTRHCLDHVEVHPVANVPEY